ncbi:MAG: hypothetical protein K9G33_11015 [Sneathiella sp.]|nr:hypothetical protein [Sneathiella sp.]
MYRAQTTIMLAVGMLVLSAPIALADSGEDSYMHGMGAGGWIFGPLMMILIIALIVGVIVLILRWMGNADGAGNRRDRAFDILNERFARGEIDLEELENRKRALDK